MLKLILVLKSFVAYFYAIKYYKQLLLFSMDSGFRRNDDFRFAVLLKNGYDKIIKGSLITAVLISSAASICFAEGLNFTQFEYITKYETTIFGEKIKFFNGDTLHGWVHSNDQIGIMQSPVFYGMVTTSASTFWQGSGYNPQFFGPGPFFNYPAATFPDSLADLKNATMMLGTYFSLPDTQYRVQFLGDQGLEIYGFPEGTPFMGTNADTLFSAPASYNEYVFYLDGPTELIATDPENEIDFGIMGRMTIAFSEDIYLLGNLRYIESDLITGEVDPTAWDVLGLISEGNILIKNTWENGRDNGGNLYPYDTWRSSIIVNSAIMALGESFSFEDQNDVITAYGGNLPEWYYSEGPNPDERGQIHFWGSMAQYRKGYVHRSNHGGTGYLKDYHLHPMMMAYPPPYWPSTPQGLEFSSEELDFGSVNVGDEATLALDMTMYGMGYLTIEDWSFSDAAFSGTPNLLIYAPTVSGRMYIDFAPDEGGEYDDILTLETTAGDYIIDLHGVGVDLKAGDGDIVNSVNEFKIVSVYPNPFNSNVSITFAIPDAEAAVITIFDIEGRVVFDMSMNCISGLNGFNWQPEMESSGLYFYKIEGGNGFVNGKLLYLK